MSIGDELLYDFDFKRPRVLIGGRFGVVDNVKRLVLLSEESIIADCGAFFVSLSKYIYQKYLLVKILYSFYFHSRFKIAY